MKFGTNHRKSLSTISLFEDDLLGKNTVGKSGELLNGDKSTIIDFIKEMEFDPSWSKYGVTLDLFEYWKKQFDEVRSEIQEKKISPITAVKSALEKTSATKTDEAHNIESAEQNLEKNNEGVTKDD